MTGAHRFLVFHTAFIGDLVLTLPVTQALRRAHPDAWIGLVDGKVVLRDYQSLNGTFINARMDDSVSEAALIDGDTIFFGGHGGDQYRFVLE